MRVSHKAILMFMPSANYLDSIVEYATREQAQQAVNTLSNQNLMGRLVYVREVCYVLGDIQLLFELTSYESGS